MSTVIRKLDLFGSEQIEIIKSKKNNKKTLFDDYDAFVAKFEPKKTTDDCYTPPEIYNCVLEYVSRKCNIGGREIIRPFFPGNDYKDVDYSNNCVVIDNPPFSIISDIERFYIKHSIDYFLFAPHLTLFSSNQNRTSIVVGASIRYENGAEIKTSFTSNMFGDAKIIGDVELYNSLANIQKSNSSNLPTYQYPDNILTVSMVHALVLRGVPFRLRKNEVHFIRGMDSQKAHRKYIFGSGFLISDKAAADKAADKAAVKHQNAITWELSEREKDIISQLS